MIDNTENKDSFKGSEVNSDSLSAASESNINQADDTSSVVTDIDSDDIVKNSIESISDTSKKHKKKKSSITSNIITVIIVLIMLAGIGLLLYPTISEKWNAVHQSRIIASYTEQIKAINTEKTQAMWDAAVKYNEKLLTYNDRFKLNDEQMEEYMSTLDATGTGVMGYITIPKIDVELAVYHTTDEAVLQIGVGHLCGTSLPVGGPSTHVALSGHRGLPSAKLFTRLDEVGNGDIFALHILDKVLIYTVDDIKVVLPEEANLIDIIDGKDYCTLITCTPYGVNTHRMLVRGEHTDTITEDEYKAMYNVKSASTNTDTSQSDIGDQGRALPDWLPLAFAIAAFLILGFALLVPVKKKPKK